MNFSPQQIGVALIIIISLSACSKKADTKTPVSGFTPLVPESTGWQRVASIANTGHYVDQNTQNRMSGYDLVVNGNNITVLYSEDKFENGEYQDQYLKASLTAGSITAPVITTGTKPYLTPNSGRSLMAYRPTLNPLTLNMETMVFFHYYTDSYFYLQLYDRSANLIITQNPFIETGPIAKMLPNGDILAGGVNLSYICELDYYKRAANQFDYINQSVGDTQYTQAYTPFVLNSEAPLAFRLYSLHNMSYLSVSDFVTASYPNPYYIPRFTEPHAEYAPTNSASYPPTFTAAVKIVAYTTSGSTFTVVLSEKNNTTSATTLSAYQWTEGNTAFTRLYQSVPISTELAQAIELSFASVACNADGTLYTLVLTNGNYHLALVSSAGERTYGTAPNSSTGDYAPFFSTLRYFNGSYYALVTPFFSGTDYADQHMDIVKLTP